MPGRGPRIETVNALAELDRIGWKYEPVSDAEVKLRCPAHDDSNPSASLNVEKNVWVCHTCKAKGDIVSFVAYVGKCSRATALAELSTRYDLEETKEISPEVVERFHKKVWEAGPLLKALRDRGMTDDMIRAARIGYHEGRITIPVYDLQGRVVNVCRYLPGAERERKMINTRGYGKIRLYLADTIEKADKVWICGGELKAYVAYWLLKEDGFAACSPTAGEGSWDPSWNRLIAGKRVWICMDVDAAGAAAATKVAASIVHDAAETRIVTLPLSKDRFPKGDINDYVGLVGAGRAELLRLADSATVYVAGRTSTQEEKGTRRVSLASATASDNVGWKLEFDAVLSAADTTPYLVPRDVDVSCSRDQDSCHLCPIKRQDPDARGFVRATVPRVSKSLLEMVDASSRTQRDALREALDIPACRAVTFEPASMYTVTDVRMTPQLEISGESCGSLQRPAYVVDMELDLNSPYAFRGRVYPHPKTQQAMLVVDEAEQTTDSLSSFSPTQEELEELRVFQPAEWTKSAIQAKLDDIYDDLEANVTKIYSRRTLHLAFDLAYHSPLFVEMGGRRINGWLNVLIAGDSSQGKSETSARLMEHYGLGERVECKNATIAGLLGGLQQLGNRWFVSWGVIPTHDRRLVHLEEVKGASTELIGRLTDMRSSGIAEIPKIERRRAHARTRLIFISNPRSRRPMSAYGFGVETIMELVGSPEDVRRFDLAVLVASGQVDVDSISTDRSIEKTYTSELCRRLVLWAWTRQPGTVRLTKDAIEATSTWARSLTDKFSEAIPLIDRGTVRHKLARLAAALAGRTFSTSSDGGIVVLPCHVEYVAEFLDVEYSSPHFGYEEMSKAQRVGDSLSSEAAVRKYIETNTKHPRDFVHGILYRDEMTVPDVMDWCAADRETAQAVVSFLVRSRAIRRNGHYQSYSKTASFIRLLKSMESTARTDPDPGEEEEF